MAEALTNTLSNLNFDIISGNWFEYNQNLGKWDRLNNHQIQQKIFFALKSDDKLKGKLTTDYRHKVLSNLELLMGVDFNAYRNINKKKRLIPFLNGVLDLYNNKLLEHQKSFYFTYNLNINYDPSAKLSTEMINFLLSISNNNPFVLKVLRSYIYCILLKDNQYQVALYLHGPGGTGKSTFEKLLISLVGSNNSSVLNLEDLNKTFTISKIIDKTLILFSDVQGYTGDPSKLRLLISGDVMNAEQKYKNAIDFQPDALVILTSNLLWSPKDSTTGLQRRIIYIPVTKVPEEINRNLFNYDFYTNECSGTLSESLPGLVNWALNTSNKNLSLLNNANETNKLISPYILNETNPLIDWINTYLEYKHNNIVYIGKKNSDPKTSLYPNYLEFCKQYRYKPLSFHVFTSSLIQQLNLLYGYDIDKKRTEHGTGIVNINLLSSPKEINKNQEDLGYKYDINDEFKF